MSALDWIFTSVFIAIYIFFLFTVCMMTFQKGHILLGILGIFVPFLWLSGAILPAKPGSRDGGGHALPIDDGDHDAPGVM